jgi:hypothetical protein
MSEPFANLKKVKRSELNGQAAPTLPAPVAASTPISTTDPLLEVLEVHYRKQKSLVLWGASGYGKSSVLKQFAKDKGIKCVQEFVIAMDPLTTAVPVANQETKQLDSYARGWLKEVTEPNGEPTMLILDEINKYAKPSTMNMLNEIILERKYGEHKIRDNVFIVAAANFVRDSETASQLDCSILKRVTNVLFAPNATEVVKGMQSELGKALAGILKPTANSKEAFKEEVLDNLTKPGSKDIPPRQIDEIANLCDGEVLSSAAVEMICVGRIGEPGKQCVQEIVKRSSFCTELAKATLQKVVAMYNSGARTEVQGLVEACTDTDVACELALAVKSPTLCAAILKKDEDTKYKGESFMKVAYKAELLAGG